MFSQGHALGPIHPLLGHHLQCLLGQGSVHHAEVHCGLFEDGFVFEDAVLFLEGDIIGDGDLGLADHFLEFGLHGVVSVGAVAGMDDGVRCLVLQDEESNEMVSFMCCLV